VISMTENSLRLSDLKAQSPKDLLAMAEELEIENASTMRKGDMMFEILRERADEGWEIAGDGVLEVLQDGFGFLRSPEANYLPGPDDIYVSPDMIRQHSLRTGDTVEGVIMAPRENERYFALTNVTKINFEEPTRAKHKVAFDNLTPLYPDERLKMEIEDPTIKDRSARIIDLVSPIGKGQRALIVAPPRTGKTVLLQNIAHSIETNHPECYLIVLADRRTARGSDGHAALREGGGHFLHLRRTCDAPRCCVRDGDRKGQAPCGTQARRGDPARLDHAPRPCLQHRGSVLGQGSDRWCGRQRVATAEAVLRRRAEHRGGRHR
jgi:hypothetical protein